MIDTAQEQIAAKVYIDSDRQPCIGPGGYVREELTRNAAGAVEKRRYYDRDGRTIPGVGRESDLQNRVEQGTLPE